MPRLPFHLWLFRKLTVRPVHSVESHYWYPIGKRATDPLPPRGLIVVYCSSLLRPDRGLMLFVKHQ
jgi:hypothetical protein